MSGRSVVGEHHGASSLTPKNSAERLVAAVIWSGWPSPEHRRHGQPIFLHLQDLWYYTDFKGAV